MGDWRDFPLPDGSYSDDTRPWTQQDVVNYLPTLAELPGTRSKHKLATAPGMETFAVVGSGPHRGARDVEGKAFVVSGNKLYQLSLTGTATELGTIPGTGQVSMTHNQIDGGNQLVIGTGDNSYVWDTVAGTLTANGVGLLSVDFLNQLILGVDTQRRFWRYSALADAKTYNDLDNESAESSPDRIVGGIVSAGEWLVFGERTIEPWAHNPTDTAQFQRQTGAISEKGCANANTIKRLDNSVFFLGNDLIVYRMQGYQPVPVSTKAQAAAFRECDTRKAFAFTYEDHGYVIYYLTFQDGQTWGYDVTNQRWHRRESFGLDRWRLNTLFKWDGEWYGGDYQDGKVYRLKWGHVYEGCEIMPRGFTTGVLHSAGNRVFVDAIQLFMDTGRAENATNDTAPSISGALPDGFVDDVVSYQYTITRAYPGQEVTLTVDGALPTGLTMDATGLVTGTLTEAGAFNFTITPSSTCATGTPLVESVTVTGYTWAMARTSSEAMYLTTDPINGPWTATTRNNGAPYSTQYLVVSGGNDKMLVIGGTTDARGYYGTDFNPTGGLATSVVALGYYPVSAGVVSGYVHAPYSNSAGYSLSADGGASFTNHAPPLSKSAVRGLARLNGGRWLLSFGNGPSVCGVMFTDDAVPTAAASWTAANFTGQTESFGSPIACNGTAACVMISNGKVYRSTDGAAWTNVYTSSVASSDRRAAIAIGDVMLMGVGQLGDYIRTDDAGLTWVNLTFPAACTPEQFVYANGVLIVNCVKDNYYSLDAGLTWATLTLPFTRSFNEGVGTAPVLAAT